MELGKKIFTDDIKKILISFVGILILAFGLAVITQLNVGKSIYTNVSLGLRDVLKKYFNIQVTIGTTFLFVDVVIGLLAYFLFLALGIKKKLIGTLIVAVSIGLFIDFWIWILNIPDLTQMFPFWIRFLMVFPLMFLLTFGVALTISAHIIVPPLDLLTLYVSKRLDKSFSIAKTILIVIFLLIGLSFMTLSGDFSHISFVSFIFSFANGPTIQMWLKVTSKIYDFVMRL